MSSFRIQFFVAFLLLVLLSQVIGHSYVTSPTSRGNQKQTQTGCRGPSCLGPCEVPLARKTRAGTAVSRGDSISVEWPRNNHAGGFIRFAWAPTSQSDSHAAFDAHVQQINCHEVGGCRPDDASNPNGGDSGPSDGSSRACRTTIQVPLDLTDGEWTLQWAWFGGAFALGDYYSCVDYRVAGGPTGTLTPVFIGGDYSNPNEQKCKFFNTDKLHQCVNEPCNNPIYTVSQQRSGVPAIGQLGVNVNVNIPSVPSTTGSVPSVPSTTAAVPVAVPSTTGARVPSTTAAMAPSTPSTPSTTAAEVIVPSVPSTTGSVPSVPSSQVPSTTGSPVSPSNPLSTIGDNCALATSVSTSQARLTAIETWNNRFHGVVVIHVEEPLLTNWVLEVTWSSPTHVSSSFNAGKLQCESSLVSYFKPSANWANNLSAGSVAQIEFIASNDDRFDSATITASTRVRVLKM